MTEAEKLNSLFELADVLSRHRDYDEILRLVTHRVLALFHAGVASVVMINPATQHTIKTIIREGSVNKQQQKLLQTNIVGWVNKNIKSFLTSDIHKDDRFRHGLFRDCTVHSAICAPFYCQSLMIGFILLLDERGYQFNTDDLVLLEKFALICAPSLANTPRIEDYFKTVLPEAALLKKYEAYGLLGKSPAFIELLKSVEAAAHCDVRVLLEGHSGTGKELIARAIHESSPRQPFPFVAVDCGAIAENLMESELFGHVKGAFTGAGQDRQGLFAEAHRGTLFIDEIENLSLPMQAKLLRAIQLGEIRAVGSNRVMRIDVRIIAASSNPLHGMVEKGVFREDLYYRLYVYPIHVPTLDERRSDIPLLVDFFLKRFAAQQHKKVEAFDYALFNHIKNRPWPGNVRELENFVERLVTLIPPGKKTISHADLPQPLQQEIGDEELESPASRRTIKEAVAEFEKQLFLCALRECEWNQSQTARRLHMSERMLRYNMQRLGIQKP